jgi:hypothetical protein
VNNELIVKNGLVDKRKVFIHDAISIAVYRMHACRVCSQRGDS